MQYVEEQRERIEEHKELRERALEQLALEQRDHVETHGAIPSAMFMASVPRAPEEAPGLRRDVSRIQRRDTPYSEHVPEWRLAMLREVARK